MTDIAKRLAVISTAALSATLFLAGTAFSQEKPAAERLQPIKITPQAVVIGEGSNGVTNVAKVMVTNTSRAPVNLNVIYGVTWITVTPASVGLEPGKSTWLSITGNLGGLEQIVAPVTREGQAPAADLGRPVFGAAPVTVSAGQLGAVFMVFAVRMGAKQ